MSRQDANAAFANTSFLYGGNAAYIEDLQANTKKIRRRSTPMAGVFPGPEGQRPDVVKRRAAPPANRTGRCGRMAIWWPRSTANWRKPKINRRQDRGQGASPRRRTFTAEVNQATRDFVRALMLIRAYRIRGHFHANLDPLGIEAAEEGTRPAPLVHRSRHGPQDFPRHGAWSRIRVYAEILAILRRTYCQTFGVEFMHISNPAQKGWIQERIEGRDKEISFTREGKRAILNKLVEAEGFEKFLDVKYTGTKRFGLDGAEC